MVYVLLMERLTRYKTINSFTRRPCFNQIVSYLVVLAQNVSFWVLVQNNYINQSTRYIMIALFTVSAILLALATLLASGSDPSDPVMIQYKNGNTSVIAQIGSPCLFCEHCQSYVLLTSRHCKVCDRCVEKFDHHCIWINNCIGRSNYCIFMTMIIAAFSSMLIYLISVALLWQENQWKNYLPSMVVNWVIAFPIFVFSNLIFALIILHLFLISQGLTTFDYIMNKRNAQISPMPLQTISSSHINELGQENPLANVGNIKRDSESQSQQNQSQQNHRTDNQFAAPPPSAFQNIQNQDRQSDFQSFDHIKSTHNRLPIDKRSEKLPVQKNNSDLNEDVEVANVDQFYKKHRGLKLLVGPAIIVRPKRSESAKIVRKSSLRSSKLKGGDDIYIEHMGIEASMKPDQKN